MIFELVAPALLSLAWIPVIAWARPRIPPRAAILALTLSAASAGVAVVWAAALLVLGALVGVPEAVAPLAWCRRALVAGHEAPVTLGVSAGLLLLVGAVRLAGFERRWRRSLRRHRYSRRLTVLDTTDRVAFSVPSAGGAVVVSRGLLNVLDGDERAALLAHESCHLSRHHHRYLRVAGWSAAVVPGLGFLARWVRIATEREADESAATVVGDRAAVASAIVAAIGSTTPFAAAAAADQGVTERVHALLYPTRAPWWNVGALGVGLAAAFLTLSSSTLQLHHLFVFLRHVCRIG